MDINKQICPYCGEPIELVVDPELAGETYVEDCPVCCRPMVLSLDDSIGELQLTLKTENDV